MHYISKISTLVAVLALELIVPESKNPKIRKIQSQLLRQKYPCIAEIT
jgi:hypothetical protein